MWDALRNREPDEGTEMNDPELQMGSEWTSRWMLRCECEWSGLRCDGDEERMEGRPRRH